MYKYNALVYEKLWHFAVFSGVATVESFEGFLKEIVLIIKNIVKRLSHK